MIEKQRQIVVFGEFSHIGFDVLSALPKNIVDKYKFQLTGYPDQPIPTNAPMPMGIQVSFGEPITRPTLKVNGFLVFIGTKMIRIQQDITGTVNAYDEFVIDSLAILESITEKYSIGSFNRIACNGMIEENDEDKIKEVFKKSFKPQSKLYGDNPTEFTYRVNTIIKNESIGADTNQIILFSTAQQINMQQPMVAPVNVLVVNYDINTVTPNAKTFNADNLKELIAIAKSYIGEIGK
jgi:hypothetical protein